MNQLSLFDNNQSQFLNYFSPQHDIQQHRCMGCGKDFFNRHENRAAFNYCSDTCQHFFNDWMRGKVKVHTPALMKYKWVMGH